MVLARRALTTDSCVFSNGPANASLRLTMTLRPPEPRYSLLPALHSRAAASSQPSGAALPPPPRPPEPRCHLLPESRLQIPRPPEPRCRLLDDPHRHPESRCRLLPALKSRAAASSSPPFKAARAAAAFQHSPPLSPERTTHPLLCHIRCRNVIQFYKRSLERTMSPNRLIVILFHASPPLSPINSHASLLSPPPLSPLPPTANDCRHLTSLPRAHPLRMTAATSPLSHVPTHCKGLPPPQACLFPRRVTTAASPLS